MRIRCEFTTALPPEEVAAALTDFSDRRPQLWPGLDPAQYEVHELGDTWAVVTEGSRRPYLWARERYDWAIPGRVSWRAEQSNFCRPGVAVVASLYPGSDGGSRVVVDWRRSPTSIAGYFAALAVRIGGDRVLGYRAALDRLAEERDREVRRAA